MVTVHRQRDWKISVYGREHGVAHFHIEGRDFRCSVDMNTLDVIVGAVPATVLKEACRWAKANQSVLLAKWRELNT
jgi:uncharacterized protein DUF4160